MTVGQLIQKLKKLDPDMPVVIKPGRGQVLRDDFYELNPSDIIELKAKAIYKSAFWGRQVYDAAEGTRERNAKVLSLAGGTDFQTGE